MNKKRVFALLITVCCIMILLFAIKQRSNPVIKNRDTLAGKYSDDTTIGEDSARANLADSVTEQEQTEYISDQIDFAAYGIIVKRQDQLLFVCDAPIDVTVAGECYEAQTQFYLNGLIDTSLVDQRIFLKADVILSHEKELYLIPTLVVNEDIQIPTSFGMLHYPAEWIDLIVVSKDVENQKYTFSANLNGKIIDLFSIFENSNGANLFGKITEDSKKPTIISFTTYKIPENLTVSESESVSVMIENINYMLDYISINPGFSPDV